MTSTETFAGPDSTQVKGILKNPSAVQTKVKGILKVTPSGVKPPGELKEEIEEFGKVAGDATSRGESRFDSYSMQVRSMLELVKC